MNGSPEEPLEVAHSTASSDSTILFRATVDSLVIEVIWSLHQHHYFASSCIIVIISLSMLD